MTAAPDGPRPAPGTAAIERAVLATLTGIPLKPAASQGGIAPAALAAASRAYQEAGRAALAAQAEGAETWGQIILEFADWDNAERTAAENLAPRLQDAELTAGWWFIRKYPHWRIRYRPTVGLSAAAVRDRIGIILDDLAAADLLRNWRHGIYEPETLVFGGPAGLTIAHELFCADSIGFLTTFGPVMPAASASRYRAGRKELSILLCAALMRHAHLDRFEQADIWHRVASLRPAPLVAPVGSHYDAIKTLLAADTAPAGRLFAADGPLAAATEWIGGFRRAGEALAAAANDGHLHRGLRDILAHLVIFHWNRLGLTVTAQAVLARAAQDVTMNTVGRPTIADRR